MKKNLIGILFSAMVVLPVFLNGCGGGLRSSNTLSSANSSAVTIYAGGYAMNASGVYIPGYWKNGTWIGLVNGVTNNALKNAAVVSMVISGSDVYAAGSSKNASSVDIPGYWKNGTWFGLVNGATGNDSQEAVVMSIVVAP